MLTTLNKLESEYLTFELGEEQRNVLLQVFSLLNEKGYQEIVQDILNKDAYGDKALKLDCKSHLLWVVYKLKKKIF